MDHVIWTAVGAALALLAQALVGTLKPGSAFDLDRSKRVAGLWAMNLGLVVMLLGLTLGYWAGLRSSPTSCEQVSNLTSAVQAMNLELDGATSSLADLSHIMDRRLFPLAEDICAKEQRRRFTHC